MTNWGYGDENNDSQAGEENELTGPKALRDAYKSLKAQNDELNAKLTGFLEDQRKQKMGQVFESLGVPGAASLYQGDADPEKAKAWVETMRATFGGTAQGVTPTPSAPALSPDQQHQLQQMTEAGQHGTPQGNMDAAAAALGSATDLNSILAAMANINGHSGG